jgi:hypothetical protein
MPIKFLNDVAVDTSVLYVDTINDKVGIGTAGPQAKLHIDAPTGDFLKISESSTDRLTLDSNNEMVLTSPSNWGGYFKVGKNVGPYEVAIELGEGRTANGLSRIDLVGDTTYADYGFRIIRNNGGANTTSQLVHRGTGNFELVSTDSGDIILNPNNGNVGIGTTSPSRALEINTTGSNDYQFRIGTSAYYYDIGRNTSNGFLNFYGNQSNASGFVFETVNGERMRIDNNGNVGIGTTNPLYSLDVNDDKQRFGENSTLFLAKASNAFPSYSDINTESAFISHNSGSSRAVTMGVSDDGNIAAYVHINELNNPSTSFVSIGTNNAEKLRIKADGNVGIGTTNPSQKFHVSGNARVTGAYYDSNNSPGTANQVLVSTVTGTDWIDGSAIPGVPDGSGTAGKIVMWQDSDTLTDSKITQTAGSETNYVDVDFANVEDLTITGDSSFSTFTVNAFDAVNFTNIENNFSVGSGDLSIATGDESMSLGTTTADSNTLTVGYTTTRFIGSGNVGIGTTSPGEKLTINGTDQYVATQQASYPWGGSVTLGLRMGTDATAGSLDFRRWTGTATTHGTALITQVNSDGGYGLDFRVDTKTSNTKATTSRMFLSTSGEVGIGTTNPGAKLHVSGSQDFMLIESTANSDAAYRSKTTLGYYGSGTGIGSATNCWNVYDFNAGAERIRIDSSGDVGIGTTSPGAKLTVVDDILLTGSSPSLTLTDATSSFVIKTNTAGEGIVQTSGTSKPIRFFRNNGSNESMRIDGDGNVGISDTSPSHRLSVSGNVKFRYDTSAGGEGVLFQNNTSGGAIQLGFQQQDSDGLHHRAYIVADKDSAGSIGGKLSFRTRAVGGGTTEAMTLRSDGNVGIGTTSPGAKLDVSGSFKLSDFTSNSVATTGSLSPNQNYQASTQDTLADLTVDPSGNVVRGMQEGTWTFTKAQLDGTLGMTLISAPGVNKAVIVYESSWMIKYNATGAISANQRYEIRQASNVGVGVVTILPGAKINEILSNGQTMPGGGASAYGFYSRDVPADVGGRTFKTNTATTLHKNVSNQLPTGVETVSIKLKYRIYDATTF